jgi:ABC-2 type transport system ATP-binding protein
MILDEPFEGLDPVNRVLITDLMKEFAAKGSTIVLSSHRMDQVEEMCRSVFLIHNGKGLLSGEVREIKERFADNSVFLECDLDIRQHPAVARTQPKGRAIRLWLKDGEAPEKFLAGLLADGAKISRYERALPSMDEVFVRVVRPS